MDVDRSYLSEGSKEKDDYEFDEKEVLCTKIAGLCHDLGIFNAWPRSIGNETCIHAGHGPFSHMFEHEVVAAVMKVT